MQYVMDGENRTIVACGQSTIPSAVESPSPWGGDRGGVYKKLTPHLQKLRRYDVTPSFCFLSPRGEGHSICPYFRKLKKREQIKPSCPRSGRGRIRRAAVPEEVEVPRLPFAVDRPACRCGRVAAVRKSRLAKQRVKRLNSWESPLGNCVRIL